MWWKLTGLAFIEAALIAVFFWPVKTQVVKIDVPSAGPTRTLHFTLDAFAVGVTFAGYALAIAVISIPIWMAYRVIQAARRST